MKSSQENTEVVSQQVADVCNAFVRGIQSVEETIGNLGLEPDVAYQMAMSMRSSLMSSMIPVIMDESDLVMQDKDRDKIRGAAQAWGGIIRNHGKHVIAVSAWAAAQHKYYPPRVLAIANNLLLILYVRKKTEADVRNNMAELEKQFINQVRPYDMDDAQDLIKIISIAMEFSEKEYRADITQQITEDFSSKLSDLPEEVRMAVSLYSTLTGKPIEEIIQEALRKLGKNKGNSSEVSKILASSLKLS